MTYKNIVAGFCAAGLFLSSPTFGNETYKISPAELKAIYMAAGLTERNGIILNACDQTTQPEIHMKDLNGDGKPEIFIMEGGSCYGNTGGNLSLLIKDNHGRWKDNFGFPGTYKVLDTKNMGYPDIEIGGPGLCFPVWRWDGNKYEIYKSCAR